MRREHFGPHVGRNEPIAGDGNALDQGNISAQALFPSIEIYRAREWSHHYELGKGQVCLFCQSGGGCKGVFAVGGQSKDERSEYMDAVLLERRELHGQIVARRIELLEDR